MSKRTVRVTEQVTTVVENSYDVEVEDSWAEKWEVIISRERDFVHSEGISEETLVVGVEVI